LPGGPHKKEMRKKSEKVIFADRICFFVELIPFVRLVLFFCLVSSSNFFFALFLFILLTLYSRKAGRPGRPGQKRHKITNSVCSGTDYKFGSSNYFFFLVENIKRIMRDNRKKIVEKRGVFCGLNYQNRWKGFIISRAELGSNEPAG